MMVITDPTYAALSARQRAVLALEAAWAGKRPDPRLLAMPRDQRAEFDRLYQEALRINVVLARLIDRLVVEAGQLRLRLASFELAASHAIVLHDLGEGLGHVTSPAVAQVLEGGCPLVVPLDLSVDDETPAGRLADVSKGLRDALLGSMDRACAAAEILKAFSEELAAPALPEETSELLYDTRSALLQLLADLADWIGPMPDLLLKGLGAAVADIRRELAA